MEPKERLECQDPEIFQSVWSRVMGGNSSPIALRSTPDLPPVAPATSQLFCFGQEGGKSVLEEGMWSCADALEDFRKLEKQLPQKLKSSLLPLVQSRKKGYNQLETAYFLMVGENYTITLEESPPVPADQRLRHRFQQGQQWQQRYQEAAFRSQDSCLTTLFLQLEQVMKEEVSGLHQLVQAVFWLKNQV